MRSSLPKLLSPGALTLTSQANPNTTVLRGRCEEDDMKLTEEVDRKTQALVLTHSKM